MIRILLGSQLLMFLGFSVEACQPIGSWEDFVNEVTAGEPTVNLCPFSISKPMSENLIINRRVHVRCEKSSTLDRCLIKGAGNHIKIAGALAEVTMEGFSFEGASECALRLGTSATKTHIMEDCDFLESTGKNEHWRGGAIKTELETSIVISNCRFVDNKAAQGAGIYHKGKELTVQFSTFSRNVATKGGGAIRVDNSSKLNLSESKFNDNESTLFGGGAVSVAESGIAIQAGSSGSGNSPCNGLLKEFTSECADFFMEVEPEAFVPGEITEFKEGIRMSMGLTLRVIAKSRTRIPFDSPNKTRTHSLEQFHADPDGAAIFEKDDGGYFYVSNAEVDKGGGGVFAVEFDSEGGIMDYTHRLLNTTRNCAGGKTPWDTWVSCEEYGKGQCWQVDPFGKQAPVLTKLVEPAGGAFESMAYDDRDPQNPRFFVTEDIERGALRRYTPNASGGLNWDLLQKDGKRHYLQFFTNNTFRWSSTLEKGRQTAKTYFPNTEGISCTNGILSFVSKRKKQLFRLDLDTKKYTVESTNRGRFENGGNFAAQPDQLIQQGNRLYFTEDGGSTPGIYVTDGTNYWALLEAYHDRYKNDETTGLAFSPDGTKMYFCIQEIGWMFEVERKDGKPFYGRQLSSLRMHEFDGSTDHIW